MQGLKDRVVVLSIFIQEECQRNVLIVDQLYRRGLTIAMDETSMKGRRNLLTMSLSLPESFWNYLFPFIQSVCPLLFFFSLGDSLKVARFDWEKKLKNVQRASWWYGTEFVVWNELKSLTQCVAVNLVFDTYFSLSLSFGFGCTQQKEQCLSLILSIGWVLDEGGTTFLFYPVVGLILLNVYTIIYLSVQLFFS